MKVLFKNTGYFLKEIKTIIKLDLTSNIFSIISLGFIFFLLSLIVSGGWTVNNMIEAIESEAEISVYYMENVDANEIAKNIHKVNGVREVDVIDEDEARNRMNIIMGEESRIIELFDHNPFNPYIEVKIDLDNMNNIAKEVKNIHGVELVRDNKEVLDKLKNISSLANILGFIVIVAVSVSTTVITSHIIRQGIYINKDQINTLRLLGAPESFITLPFILEGIIISLLAASISMGLISMVIKYIGSIATSSLPFLILPNANKMIFSIGTSSIILSIILGLIGSLFGLLSTKSK